MEEGDRTRGPVAINRSHEETVIMNIGTVKRNMKGVSALLTVPSYLFERHVAVRRVLLAWCNRPLQL